MVLTWGVIASNYSLQMAQSIMSRQHGILKIPSDILNTGVTQKAFRKVVQLYPDHPLTPAIEDYIQKSVDSTLETLADPQNDTKLPLDRLSNGNELINLFKQTTNFTYKDTILALRDSIDYQPRNSENGLWYYIYPNWSYLDGMYSFGPFQADYIKYFGDWLGTKSLDLLDQFYLLREHCKHNNTGLLVHGYDESKKAVWANPNTGASPHVWGRSLGWYLTALVDTLEVFPFPPHSPQHDSFKSLLNNVASAVMTATDPASGLWWQVMDSPGKEGNYIESSGSAMFIYALFKGARLGYLDAPVRAKGIAKRGYENLVDRFVVRNDNGTLGWNGTVAVCSLNSTASYEYYVGQPILYNSPLGEGAFVLASVEYEMFDNGNLS
ncbi:Six-hairpin glycosidase [Microthyrium microscopicum]|uniref:Six-hairpin glycosidase n=1 Tax=Microthyrium microscopicum TaxID=703497 RepID=A0A6A6U4S5_9PEZI|nr:Six-hairpin glycosidase [Microthyrium microscopicum]